MDFGVTFYGVRGSTPCHGRDVARYGGNTSCVVVHVAGQAPIMLDLGTGSRYFGAQYPPDEVFDATCLVSHLHWDHVQGLPFFPPALRPGGHLAIHAPRQSDGRELVDVFRGLWCHPTFPVGIDDLPADFTFHAHGDDEFAVGAVKVTSRFVPHIGNTLGYRIEREGRSVVYISDHQQPGVDVYETTDAVRELCVGADLLIHDAQYTRAEFVHKADWGHCTVDYAVWLAKECEVGTLALFHHDPCHDDLMLDCIAEELEWQCGRAITTVVAREGQSLVVGEP